MTTHRCKILALTVVLWLPVSSIVCCYDSCHGCVADDDNADEEDEEEEVEDADDADDG